MTFLPHLRSKKLESANIQQNLLKFASSQGGMNKIILKTWYKRIIEKKITYASPVWYPHIQKSRGHQIISSIQYLNLLTISRAYKKTAASALCVLTGIIPLHIKMKEISVIGRVSRLGIPMDGHEPSLYQTKVSKFNLKSFKKLLSNSRRSNRSRNRNIH